jgi:hypothetical protein
VVSPKKQRSSVQEKPEKHSIPTSKSRGRPRLNITRTITPPELPLYIPEHIAIAEINLDALPPKTPAVEDIFSPPSTEPSTQRPESKDTPPPGDLTSVDQIGAARPGRRSRPQVSYKEPSLNTKMRRPDAKLVDAIVDRRTSVDPQMAPSTLSKSTVKRETFEELGWKPVSAISGRAGEEEVETGSPLRQKLDRRESQDVITSSPAEQQEVKPSSASKAISALINETSTAKRKVAAPLTSTLSTKSTFEAHEPKPSVKPAPKEPIVKQEEPSKDSLAVFDFTDSSPADTATNPRTRINELAKAARNARRHSSIPASSHPDDRRPEKSDGALPLLHKRTGSGSGSGTAKSTNSTNLARSGSTSSIGKSGTASAARVNGVREKKISTAATGRLTPSESRTDLHDAAPGSGDGDGEAERTAKEISALRAERAASRRKSMMI